MLFVPSLETQLFLLLRYEKWQVCKLNSSSVILEQYVCDSMFAVRE